MLKYFVNSNYCVVVSFEVLTTMLLLKIQIVWNVVLFELLKWQSQCNMCENLNPY